MGRRRIEIKRIPERASRVTTFNKRKKGLFKKAYELGVLTGCKISLFIEGEDGSAHPFDPSEQQPAPGREILNGKTSERSQRRFVKPETEQVQSSVLQRQEDSSRSLVLFKSPRLSTLDATLLDTILWDDPSDCNTLKSNASDPGAFDFGVLDSNTLECSDSFLTEAGPAVKGCIEVADPLQSSLVQATAFPPLTFELNPFQLRPPPLPFFPDDMSWPMGYPMQMPPLFG
ncbi:MADS-box domain-containing protein [Fusarium sp. Ph1]|nr:MADS-box domain-containing protein [Fusarium sp. Ph1]